MAITKGSVSKGKRIAFLCNRIHLVEQASRRFTRAGISHGIIQGENTTRTYENVLIASIQTVARRGLPDVDLLLIDEAHAVAGSKEFRDVIMRANVPVLGLSATPFSRGLGKHYDELGGALFEQMVIAATIPELIELGFLVDCDVYAPSEPDMTGIKQTKNAFGEMDWSDADMGRAVDKPDLIGDIVKHWFRLANGTPTVCFASNIAHSKHIVEQFLAAGVPAEHIDCYTDDLERQAILRRIETGETLVISNVGILCEGWDFPACKTLILARPTKSLVRYLQMAGRVLRPHESKDRALILDHSGTVSRLGFPTDEFPFELDDGSPRECGGDGERKAALPKPCPSCSYMKTAPKCPVCGFVVKVPNNVTTGEGELVKLSKKASQADKQAFYSQLLAIAAAKGYAKGWCSHKYREKFGVWPKGLKEVAAEPTAEVKNFLRYLQIRQAKAKEAQRAAA
jgi:superfamily II DNA or RNA helicase